jgi:SEC-C motif domain protein
MVVVEPGLSWTGLEIAEVAGGGESDEEGKVAFAARWRSADGQSGVLIERSRFVRRSGRWLYVDGEH